MLRRGGENLFKEGGFETHVPQVEENSDSEEVLMSGRKLVDALRQVTFTTAADCMYFRLFGKECSVMERNHKMKLEYFKSMYKVLKVTVMGPIEKKVYQNAKDDQDGKSFVGYVQGITTRQIRR